ncbi:uncharacterized protein LOC121547637 [Coregonus clupeaformis]|uniref:uncharacterized protein LOC121547637 n=1 Tax=Coregonus clupeaformis TaxID=59861 RepID=UPI001BE097B5|nr:uncharacterized protein LOC121547637 [Coregonus clupeaformis]
MLVMPSFASIVHPDTRVIIALIVAPLCAPSPAFQPSIMRMLLDSGWMKFGPAGRGSLDWVPGSGPSPLPSLDKHAQGDHWNELTPSEDIMSKEFILYIVVATTSLLFISLVGFLVYRRCSTSKLALTNIIALDLEELQDLQDLQDAESSTDFLSSLALRRDQMPSCSSETDMSDGVFLMVYLPTPYEETLTKLARAASIRSSKGVDRSVSVRSSRGVDRAEGTRTRGLNRAATVRNSRDVDPPKIDRSASVRSSRGVDGAASINSAKGVDPSACQGRTDETRTDEDPVKEQSKD